MGFFTEYEKKAFLYLGLAFMWICYWLIGVWAIGKWLKLLIK